MGELETFLQREMQLKRTLPFKEWLRHLLTVHDELARLVHAGHDIERRQQVEVIDRRGEPVGGIYTVSTYELPADCHRILVDVQQVHGTVWGFFLAHDMTERQANGKLVERRADTPVG